jgi:hypothetical protein
MPTIAILSNAKIQMFADDHAPPHFHLYGAKSNAQIRLDTLTVLRGRVDAADLREAAVWAAANGAFLAAEWSRLNER